MARKCMASENQNDEIDEILKEVKAKSAAAGGTQPAKAAAPPPKAEEPPAAAVPAAGEREQEVSPPAAGADNHEKEGRTLNKKILAGVMAAVIVIAAGVYFGFFHNKNTVEETTAAPTQATTQKVAASVNPLTGESGFSESALNTRVLGVVVENSAAARPQYNMDSADIVMEVEVEGGITRMLWLYADMAALPEQVGPVRSARPVLVELSELFGSIFVHYGGSHSTGNYVGGYDVIANDKVDNIDGMSVSSCFKRTSDKASPHNAVLLGGNVVSAVQAKGYGTGKGGESTQLTFYDSLTPVSGTPCSSVAVRISSVTDTHTLTYSANSGLYTNVSDYGRSVSFSNVIVLYANTSYVTTGKYTYCLYTLAGGGGKLISGGSAADISWRISGSKLSLTNASGEEVKLNKGKSWIAVASSNNGGGVTVLQ